MSDTNYIAPRPMTTETDRKVLSQAKLLEKKRKKDGWKYVNATPTIRVLVPCDEDGEPTEKGRQIISEIINR
jgi:hypothetical protein